MDHGLVSAFLTRHFHHFNAKALIDAAFVYKKLVESGERMFVAIAGAMSTAEIGISLAEMIRNKKVHAICCTGANLEEDVFNLIGHKSYQAIPNYRDLTPADEHALYEWDLNRVTDTCIPEEVIKKVEAAVLEEWTAADRSGVRMFPHEFLFRALANGRLRKYYDIDSKDSWVCAAMDIQLPIFVPGWEDSTLGNLYAVHCQTGDIQNVHTVKNGVEYLLKMAEWYMKTSSESNIGFLQIGGGIAGDFAVCVVPMLREDLKITNVPMWSYYCQISESTTSYGSYSGAPPNEKITWGKLKPGTPKFMIESDASIVAPLFFALVLDY